MSSTFASPESSLKPSAKGSLEPSKVLVGTAGWAYPHWNGVVYPQTPQAIKPGTGFHALDLISRHTDCVEINSSFYQPLKPELVKLWIRRVERNPNFQFTAKLHRKFTHDRVLADTEAKAFKEGLWPLLRAGKMGALLLQFPWAFRFTEENRDFFIRLRRAFHEFPLVAEMRHDSWLAEEAQGVFLDYKVGFCNLDQPAYTRAMPPTAILTSGVGYVRLHGRNPHNSLGAFDKTAVGSVATRQRQHDYLYSESELTEWRERIDRISRFSDRTFVVFNNDAAGKSFVNALQLKELLGSRRTPAPLGLRRKYPVALEHYGPRSSQQSLFPVSVEAA